MQYGEKCMEKYNIIFPMELTSFYIIRRIINLKEEKPEIFNDSINKIGFIGNIPYCIWSARNQSIEIYSYERIENDFKYISDNNLILILEFDNTKLEEKHFIDTYMNMVLMLAKDVDIYAIIYNEKLAEYVKNKYPYVKTVRMDSKDVIPPFDYCLTYSKEETAPNYIYTTDIQRDIETLNRMSEDVLNFEIIKQPAEKCDIELDIEDIEKLSKSGIESFIIKVSPEDKYDMVNAYIKYLIKNDYQNEVRLNLLKMLAFPK